jgi:hypothetical protein
LEDFIILSSYTYIHTYNCNIPPTFKGIFYISRVRGSKYDFPFVEVEARSFPPSVQWGILGKSNALF